MTGVGDRIRSIEWQQRTDGSLVYTPDVTLPGVLHARIVRSQVPHGRIRSLDTAAAAAMAGVACVLTGADLPEIRYPHEGPRLADRTVFARDKVRFLGEEVAAVAAETPAQATAAAAAVRVRYRQLPALTTVAQALRPGAPRIHERASGTNVSLQVERGYGDLDAARAAGTTVVRGTYAFGRQAHACMETNGTVASWDAAAQLLEVWTSTQATRFVRKELAVVLDLPEEQIIVRETAIGGGFGSKSKITDHEAITALLSIRTGRPVRLVLDRDEEFISTKSRHAFTIELETGATADGTLTHRDAAMVVDNGAYNHAGASVTGAAVGMLSSLYRTRAIRILTSQLVDTNMVPGGQFRGYGGPQVTFAIESQMDELADALGVDPIDLRMANANLTGDVTHSGYVLGSARLEECLTAARKAIGWDAKRALRGSGRGVGIAVTIHPSGVRNYPDANRSEATIELHPDGHGMVRFGGTDPGTGLKTVVAQIAATELGLEPADVQRPDHGHRADHVRPRLLVLPRHRDGRARHQGRGPGDGRTAEGDRRGQVRLRAGPGLAGGRAGQCRRRHRGHRRPGRARPGRRRLPGRDRVGRGRHRDGQRRHRRRERIAVLLLRRARGGGGGRPGHRRGARA